MAYKACQQTVLVQSDDARFPELWDTAEEDMSVEGVTKGQVAHNTDMRKD